MLVIAIQSDQPGQKQVAGVCRPVGEGQSLSRNTGLRMADRDAERLGRRVEFGLETLLAPRWQRSDNALRPYQMRFTAKPSNSASFETSTMSSACAWAINRRSKGSLCAMPISPAIRA